MAQNGSAERKNRRNTMDDEKNMIPILPATPAGQTPRKDVDDLIFQGEGWRASDR
jgi:hypothetical protein